MRRTGWAVALTLAVVTSIVPVPVEPEPIGHIERLDPRFDALVTLGVVLEKVADEIEWAEGPVWTEGRLPDLLGCPA